MVREQKRSENIAVVADTGELLRSQDSPLTRIRSQWMQIKANFNVLLSPGDKQFKDLPKRVRLMLTSFAIPTLFAVCKILLLPETTSMVIWGMIGLALAVLTYGGMYWGVKAQVRKDSYFSVLPFPSIFVFANILFLSSVFVGEVNRLYLWGLFAVSLVMFMVTLYILALAINVLNVTLFYTIPLSRLGETVAYIAAVVTVFLLSFAAAVLSLPLVVTHEWVKLALLVVVYGGAVALQVGALFRYFVPYYRGFLSFVSSITIAILLSFGVFAITAPFAWLTAVMTSLVAYIVFGYVIHKEQNTFKTAVIWEYIALMTVMFLMVILM